MQFAIHCIDRPDGLADRLSLINAHRAYLASQSTVRIIVSGPLFADGSETMVGSLFIVDAADLSAAKAFNGKDPFQTKSVWEKVHIHSFCIMTDNRD